jgi:hypothetical protein
MAADVLSAQGIFRLEEADPPRGEPPVRCVGYLTKPVIVTAGYGGWSRVARPRKKALTEWVGRDSTSLEIEFLLDAFTENDGLFVISQERALERLAGLDINDPEPPLCRILSRPPALIPHNFHHASQVLWFVETITWDKESIESNSVGNHTRIGGTFTITQFVDDERLASLTSVERRKKASGAGRGAARKTYTVKAGDTLSKIAARSDVYGDASKWKKIGDANGIRDPKKLRTGQVLKIP